MTKATDGKTKRAPKDKAAPKRGLNPTHQDGALGAGGTSALIVLANYISGKRLPADVIAAAAPFASFGLTYLVAAVKHYQSVQQEINEMKEFERGVQELLSDKTISDEKKNQLKLQWEEIRFLSIEARRQKIIARHDDIMSVISVSGSDN